MKAATTTELSLAQSQTDMFVRGLETGIEAVDRFIELPTAGLHLKNFKNNMDELVRRIGRIGEFDQVYADARTADKWTAAAAVTVGHRVGVEYALEEKIGVEL